MAEEISDRGAADAPPINAAERDALFSGLACYGTLIIAVSGGADSTALLHLIAGWRSAREHGPDIVVATVDHGLRDGSAEEAEWVRDRADGYGLAHRTLCWQGRKPESGLQDAAREARYSLLGGLAQTCESPAIVTAHQADDQVETVLMRLMRGSGPDGLAGIATSTLLHGVPVERPLLAIGHARLVATLEAADRDWLEDPSNSDRQFERVRIRDALQSLSNQGLSLDRAALSAIRLRRAQEALDATTAAFVGASVQFEATGFARLDKEQLFQQPAEIGLRVLRRVLASVGGQSNPVRMQRLEDLYRSLDAAEMGGRTLAGCIVRAEGTELAIYREPGREGLPELAISPGETALWDRRFEVSLSESEPEAAQIRAFDTTQMHSLDRNFTELRPIPAPALAGIPAFWRHESLIAVPQIGYFCPSGSGAAPCRSRFIMQEGA